MNIAVVVLRLVLGGLFVGHGSQKLFGWFGGHGMKGTASFFQTIGLSPALPLAVLAGTAELVGGLLLAFGLLVPLAVMLLIGVMVTAIAAVHLKNGLWITNGGFEYPLVMAAATFVVGVLGPGSISLDHVFGIHWFGLYWAAAAALAGGLGGLLGLSLGPIARRLRRGGEERIQAA
jgi:putative oxidoreductase